MTHVPYLFFVVMHIPLPHANQFRIFGAIGWLVAVLGILWIIYKKSRKPEL